MKIYSECENCHKKGFFIRKRNYETIVAGRITSKDKLCQKCYNSVKKMIANVLK